MNALIAKVENHLLPNLHIESDHPHEPIVVHHLPEPWQLVGTGNYACVVSHPDHCEWVVKIYAPNRGGLQAEAEAYRRINRHPAYPACLHSGDTYLILALMNGITLYECLAKGIHIPKRVIADIDEALEYARSQGLHPHDIHAKNVMMVDGRGIVIDISDFLKQEHCTMWEDFKKAYQLIYIPFMYRKPFPIPVFVLEMIRKGYRKFFKSRSTMV